MQPPQLLQKLYNDLCNHNDFLCPLFTKRTTEYLSFLKEPEACLVPKRGGWELKVKCLFEHDEGFYNDWEFSLHSDGDYILNHRDRVCSVDEDYTKFLELLPDFWVYEGGGNYG